MTVTTKPQARDTLPPETTTECAYEEILRDARLRAPRVGLALAAALVTEHLGADTQAALAPRIYGAVKHG